MDGHAGAGAVALALLGLAGLLAVAAVRGTYPAAWHALTRVGSSSGAGSDNGGGTGIGIPGAGVGGSGTTPTPASGGGHTLVK